MNNSATVMLEAREVAVVYLLFCTIITKLQALVERQLNAHGFQ